MDTTTINHISLCSGYGGIDLGLSRAMGHRLRTIAYSEIEAFACANLVAKMEAGLLDSAPIWSDLKSFPWEEFRGLVDIVSGGYPCQPFSAAGKRAGKDDPRHLWPWIADGVAICRPRLCFFENVEGHVTLGLRDVIEDLGRMGYRTTWGVFSASEVGAPHQRKRVFILAERGGERGEAGLSGSLTREEGLARIFDNSGDEAWPSRPGEPQHGWEPPRVLGGLAHTTSQRSRSQSGDALHQGRTASETGRKGLPKDAGWSACAAIPDNQSAGGDGSELADAQSQRAKLRQGVCSEERGSGRALPRESEQSSKNGQSGQVEPSLGGNPDGSPDRLDHAELYVTCDNRTDELRLLGNGVVPATAERAFLTLLSELES